AQGELLSSTLGAAYLREQGLDFGWFDAREWLDALALPNQAEWTRRMAATCRREADDAWRERFASHSAAPMLLTQGFIARHGEGGTALLGRSGSDTSAALFGALLKALRWRSGPTCRACSAPIRARCPTRACCSGWTTPRPRKSQPPGRGCCIRARWGPA